MKKQFSHSLNYGRRKSSNVLVWTFGSAFLLAVIFIGLRISFPGAVIALASPLWKGGSSLEAGVGNTFSGLGNGAKIAQENSALSAEVSTLQNQNAVLTTRAQDLTKLLGGQSDASANILAGVLARPPESPYDTLIVDQGSKDGVQLNAQVFATGGIPI